MVAPVPYLGSMRKRRSRGRASAPVMMAELALLSAVVVTRRLSQMLQGRCSAAEYHRMHREKLQAAAASALALARPRKPTATSVLAPWHKRARANAKRLSRNP